MLKVLACLILYNEKKCIVTLLIKHKGGNVYEEISYDIGGIAKAGIHICK